MKNSLQEAEGLEYPLSLKKDWVGWLIPSV